MVILSACEFCEIHLLEVMDISKFKAGRVQSRVNGLCLTLGLNNTVNSRYLEFQGTH